MGFPNWVIYEIAISTNLKYRINLRLAIPSKFRIKIDFFSCPQSYDQYPVLIPRVILTINFDRTLFTNYKPLNQSDFAWKQTDFLSIFSKKLSKVSQFYHFRPTSIFYRRYFGRILFYNYRHSFGTQVRNKRQYQHL